MDVEENPNGDTVFLAKSQNAVVTSPTQFHLFCMRSYPFRGQAFYYITH